MGNWTLVEEWFDSAGHYNYTETYASWRISRSTSVDFGFLTYDFYVEYSKANGILNHWYLRIVDGYGDEVGLVDVVRLGGNQNPLIILTIAGAAGIIVILAVAIYMKKN